MLDELLEIILLDAEEHMEKSLTHLRRGVSYDSGGAGPRRQCCKMCVSPTMEAIPL